VSQVSLGDLARTLDRLAPENAATREEIAKLLGFELREILQEKDVASRPAPPKPEPPIVRVPPPSQTPAEQDSTPPQRIEPVSREQSRPLRLLLDGPSLDRPRTESAALPFAPLFQPAWERNLISTTVATRAPNGPVDLARLVDTAARGRPLQTIPRLSQPSLFRGAQVLVDLGEGMELFSRDQVHLLEEIRRIVGYEATAVVQFRNNPLRGAGVTPWTWSSYRPPHPGTPVLALTDLGIGGPALDPDRSDEAEWLTFAERLTHASCPLVALIPYPERRWPRKLRRQITIVCWDRSTTVGAIFRKIRRGHEVRL
jgi:hypothetical protein